jgi:hypothetical protein
MASNLIVRQDPKSSALVAEGFCVPCALLVDTTVADSTAARGHVSALELANLHGAGVMPHHTTKILTREDAAFSLVRTSRATGSTA